MGTTSSFFGADGGAASSGAVEPLNSYGYPDFAYSNTFSSRCSSLVHCYFATDTQIPGCWCWSAPKIEPMGNGRFGLFQDGCGAVRGKVYCIDDATGCITSQSPYVMIRDWVGCCATAFGHTPLCIWCCCASNMRNWDYITDSRDYLIIRHGSCNCCCSCYCCGKTMTYAYCWDNANCCWCYKSCLEAGNCCCCAQADARYLSNPLPGVVLVKHRSNGDDRGISGSWYCDSNTMAWICGTARCVPFCFSGTPKGSKADWIRANARTGTNTFQTTGSAHTSDCCAGLWASNYTVNYDNCTITWSSFAGSYTTNMTSCGCNTFKSTINVSSTIPAINTLSTDICILACCGQYCCNWCIINDVSATNGATYQNIICLPLGGCYPPYRNTALWLYGSSNGNASDCTCPGWTSTCNNRKQFLVGGCLPTAFGHRCTSNNIFGARLLTSTRDLIPFDYGVGSVDLCQNLQEATGCSCFCNLLSMKLIDKNWVLVAYCNNGSCITIDMYKYDTSCSGYDV